MLIPLRTPWNWSLCLFALSISLLICSCGESSSNGSVTWRFAIEETTGSVQDRYAQEFKRRIEDRLAGEVQVKVFPFGTLGTSDDLTEQLRMGSLQLAMASPGHLGKTIPELQVFLLHFLFPDDEAIAQRALASPELRRELDPLYAAKGMALLGLIPEGWMVWSTQKEVRRPSDFKGVKIRTMTSPLLLAAYRAYGAQPQAMPYGEVYSALQLNMIDAQVNPMFAIEEMSFYEVTSHLISARTAPFLTTLVAHPGFLDQLSPSQSTAVEEVVRELEQWSYAQQSSLNASRLDDILASKPEMIVIELNEEERQRFRELARPVQEQYLEATGDSGRRVLDALKNALGS